MRLVFSLEGTTYVPLRYISELLQKKVKWDGQTSSINILDLNLGEKIDNNNQISNEEAKNKQIDTNVSTSNILEIKDLSGTTIFDKASFSRNQFRDVYFIGGAPHFDLLSEYLSVGDGSNAENFRRLDSTKREKIMSDGIVFFHVLNYHEFTKKDNFYLPMEVDQINSLLKDKKAFVVVKKVDGVIQILFAAQDNVSLKKIVSNSFTGKTADLRDIKPRDKVDSYYELMNNLSEPPADLSIIVDLRQPKENGTAIVYINVKKGSVSSLNFNSLDFKERPENIIAYYDYQTGELEEEVYLTHQELQAVPLNNGFKVYEVRPYFLPTASPQSIIKENYALIRISALLPYLESSKPIAVKFLIPDHWKTNVPYSEGSVKSSMKN
ncbi:hypothetical protein BHF71_11210 [Vulcanibacillus modesticaldus]|uniref:Copper amine oxidase-like N-terminal domain-containing protein n=1 Tax=Vulcanibacillus modesticaldus TaxID=337097 RepID=A0A1D2YSC6_9BACI|nr:stalk domain-containing protein [Vulcanibacillus modesticaldus]OEF97209.1 hypothetical protein BHF71_11210 [Vulcanibacillus modesticaldus]